MRFAFFEISFGMMYRNLDLSVIMGTVTYLRRKWKADGKQMINYLLKFLIITAVLTPFYLLVRRLFKRSEKREAALAVFVLFTLALLVLAFEGNYSRPSVMVQNVERRIVSGEGINLIPFRTIGGFFRHFVLDIFLVNIVGNLVMFMPWGFGLVLLWKRNQSVGRILLLCFGITVLIESVQLFIGRSVDVDDLILNFLGGGMGAALCVGLKKKFKVLEEFAK